MVNIDKSIATLEDRLKQLKTKQHRINTRRRALDVRRSRKEDTRRKILVGAVVLARVERGDLSETHLRQWLSESLTRSDDRELFSLPPAGSQHG